MHKVTRRSFVTAMAAATLLPRRPSRAAHAHPCDADGRCDAGRPPYRFFDAAEAQFIETACERLIPADASGTGAAAAGVTAYLDRQLAGGWGDGALLYREGSWQPGSPTPCRRVGTPADQFRHALGAILQRLRERGIDFSRLSVAAQDALLAGLENGSADLPEVPMVEFFATLLMLTVEGFFSHPLHGAGRDRIAWRVGGFAGAHALTHERQVT